MPIYVYIGDERRQVRWRDAEIEDVFAATGDHCTITLDYDNADSAHGLNYLPRVGELLTIEYVDSRDADIRLVHERDPDTNLPTGRRVQEIPAGKREFSPMRGGVGDFGGIPLFRGVITEYDFHYKTGGSEILLEAEDLTYRLDSKMVAGVFTQRTVEDMVAEIIEQHGPRDPETSGLTIDVEFTPGSATSVLPRVFQWKKLSQALQEIAEERRYVWWMDFTGKLNFLQQDDRRNVAPIREVRPDYRPPNLANPSALDIADQERRLHESRLIRDFRFNISIAELKNAIYIKEFWFESPNTLHGPGPTDAVIRELDETEFTEDIGGRANPSLSVASGDVIAELDSFVVYVQEGGFGDFQVYNAAHHPGNDVTLSPGFAYVRAGTGNFVLVRRDDANPRFPDGTLAYWNYRALRQESLPELVIDQVSIEEFRKRETGEARGDGQYQFMFSFGSLEFVGDSPIQTLHEYLETYISQYAWPEVTGSFEIVYSEEYDREGNPVPIDSDGFGWQAGQTFDLLNEDWGLVSQPEFMQRNRIVPVRCIVQQVVITMLNPWTIKYKIEFTSRFRNT